MSDTYRRYRAIAQSLVQLYPQAQGHQRRHLAPLCLLIAGIVGSQHTQLPKVVEPTPGSRANDERVVMRFRRFLKHDRVSYDRWMLLVAQALLSMLARQPLIFVIDGSSVARGCMRLMLSVLYRGRALPITWVGVKARKGHLSDALYCALLEQLKLVMPDGAEVTILGAGEFDGTAWQQAMGEANWRYGCRTAADILLSVQASTIPLRDLGVERGRAVGVEGAAVTAMRFGPVNAIAGWEAAYDVPLYLVTNHTDREHAIVLY